MEESIIMWNRLEGSLRNENQLENALRFEVRDALWMLTRQWQFGEFEAEDAGTAAYVSMKGQQSPITGVGPVASTTQPFNYDQSPIELAVEREVFKPDICDRLEMGRHWERLLKKRLAPERSGPVIQQFRYNAKFQFSTNLPKLPDRIDQFNNAQRYSDESWMSLLASLSGGRALDGYSLLLEIVSGKQASIFLTQADEKVNAAGNEFLAWFNRVYSQAQIKSNTWHDQHLEYQPKISFNDTIGQEKILTKEEYFGDGIEWHGFIPKAAPIVGIPRPPVPENLPKESGSTVIPSGVRFRGMPSTRLWEMEDGQVDFGSIRASSTELSKMIFAEFGLVYGNDWLVAPFKFANGNMCRISSMIVTDVFGRQSVLEEIKPDMNWAFFQTLSSFGGTRWLFLATGSNYILESKPVEKVNFLRDEMANLVWGVEEIVSNPYGGGRDGEMLAKQTTQLIKSLQKPAENMSTGKSSSEGWSYKAGSVMAENKIPFIPMAVDPTRVTVAGPRKVILQRAATPRVYDELPPVRIRPRTTLLGYNGKKETEKPDPLFIFEEEVPRAGMELSLVWKRARWFNGQTFTWLARKKTIGRGEVDADFRFDTLRK